MIKRLQAKHIADDAVLAVIDKVQRESFRWTTVGELCSAIDMPMKVILAKCSSMIRRELIRGCACGCSGNFERTPKHAANSQKNAV